MVHGATGKNISNKLAFNAVKLPCLVGWIVLVHCIGCTEGVGFVLLVLNKNVMCLSEGIRQ